MSKNVIVVAGPNGSGKTTFAREYLRDSEISEYISADAIAEKLVSRPEDLDSAKLQAGRQQTKLSLNCLCEMFAMEAHNASK